MSGFQSSTALRTISPVTLPFSHRVRKNQRTKNGLGLRCIRGALNIRLFAQATSTCIRKAHGATKTHRVMMATAAASENDKESGSVKSSPKEPSSSSSSSSSSSPSSPSKAKSDKFYNGPGPGMRKLSDIELAEQTKRLGLLAEEMKKERLDADFKANRLFGFTRRAEVLNGRVAMFFFATGLLTEYWTGESIPQQLETLFRTLGAI